MGVMSNEFSALSGANAASSGALDTSAGSSNADNNDDENADDALLSRPIPAENPDPLAHNVFVFSQKKRKRGESWFRIYDEAMTPLLLVDRTPLAGYAAPATVYADEERARRVFTLFQSSPALLGAGLSYLVLDENDVPLAVLRRSSAPFRPTVWHAFDAARPRLPKPPKDGGDNEPTPTANNEKGAKGPHLLVRAHEEDRWKTFVRGLPYVEALGGGQLLRTNFVLSSPTRRTLGYFVRGFTMVDKFVLDLRPDARARRLDRRVALGLALILETA